MEDTSAELPQQSDYHHSILDHSQPVQIECRDQIDPKHPSIITMQQKDVISILEWAYPDVVYREEKLPKEKTAVFPGFILADLRRKLSDKTYTGYEVRYDEKNEEYFLIGTQDGQRYHLALWRRNEEVRTLRMIIDDTALRMHQFISRHGRIGKLSIFLGAGGIALNITYTHQAMLSYDRALFLLYSSHMFFGLAGFALIWFFLNFRKYQSATTIIMVESIEDDQVGGVIQ